MTNSKLDLARELLLAGKSIEEAAAEAVLDVVTDEHGHPMIAAVGWVADYGNAAVEYPQADSGEEAADLYVDGGDWGEPESATWVRVCTWRTGVRGVECAYCDAPATGHDAEGDPTCLGHAYSAIADGREPQPLVVDARTERESHQVAIEPKVSACVGGQDLDWQAPLEIVGGIEENPGVWGSGGGVKTVRVCTHCGCGMHTDNWAQDPQDGEQGLTSVRYEAGEFADELEAAS